MFSKLKALALATCAAMASASPTPEIHSGATTNTSHVKRITVGVGIITYADKNCPAGPNQGTTLAYQGPHCVNWADAQSFRIEKGTMDTCLSNKGGEPDVKFFHEVDCRGYSYGVYVVPFGCHNLVHVEGGWGSALVTC